MRSDQVFGAMTNVPNRYLLSQLAAKAARKLHRSGTRMQDTTNDVLVRFSRGDPIESAWWFPKRQRNIRAALERIIEKAGEVDVTASAVVRQSRLTPKSILRASGLTAPSK
ncbi:MAG: DNA-directed RNA polymerase subunit omega [Silvibacterium sp.]